MLRYDYKEALKNDIREYIRYDIDLLDFDSLSDLEDYLNEQLWVSDSVTGNASGSYTFNTWKAEEYLCHNLDLLAEALREFGCTDYALEKGAEWCDVTIRCYLLGNAIAEVLEEVEEAFEECHCLPF